MVGHDLVMSVIMGLDVSTSCTGVCVLDDMGNIVLLDRIEFTGCKTFWDKVDRADAELVSFLCKLDTLRIDRVVLEEPLMGFRPGMSSALTISQLMRFNGIVSNCIRMRTNAVPEYIGSAHARKLCGIKLQRTAIAGMSQKDQVFKHMSEHDLKHVQWPLKKNGEVADWSRDATDAYVIARAAMVNGPVVVSKKPKKSKRPAT